MALPADSCRKPFGYCKVKWLIDNFTLQTIAKNWLIQSPEFIVYGSKETSWLMTLRPILANGSTCVSFNLKRSVIDSGPKYVRLNLKVCCIISGKIYVCFDDTLLSLRNGSNYKACFGSIESLLSEMKKSNDEFMIVCHMFVYNTNSCRAFGESNQEGFKLLSKNMLDLYRSARYFDTKLIFHDNIILAHKAILWARNEYLRFLLEEDDNDEGDIEVYELLDFTVIDFTGKLNYKGMKKILAYLYTGDIRHVLEEPSFAINDCASFLDISEIETYYNPDKLLLKSTIDIEEYTYTLSGYHLKKSGLMWHYDTEGFMKIFQLYFYPNKDCEDYIKLFTKTYQTTINARLKLDFIHRSVNLFSVYLMVINGELIDIKKKFDDEYTDTREKFSRHLKNLNSCEVIINLKISCGMKNSFIDKYVSTSVSCINEDMYYEFLSIDMECLLDGGLFTDTAISNNGIHFWVHKCILTARSQMLSDLLLINEDGELIPINLEPHTISVLLTYIYSGLLSDVSDEDVIEVYKASILTNLPQLKSMCSKWLDVAFKTNKNLRCRVVKIAETYGDSHLMKSVLNHLFDKKDIFSINYDPSYFQDVRACRHCLSTS